MTSKANKTLERVFKKPVPADIKWREIEIMLISLGGEIEERAGSRIVVKLGDMRQVFHRPHPDPNTKKGAVVAVRKFLEGAGIK